MFTMLGGHQTPMKFRYATSISESMLMVKLKKKRTRCEHLCSHRVRSASLHQKTKNYFTPSRPHTQGNLIAPHADHIVDTLIAQISLTPSKSSTYRCVHDDFSYFSHKETFCPRWISSCSGVGECDDGLQNTMSSPSS